jgi:hypothetical protein
MMTLLTIVFFWLVEHARIQRYLLAYVATERRSGDQALDEDGRVQPDLTRGASAT